MNTITKQTLIEAGKLATIYAGKLRAEGYTPGKSRAVTPDKFMRCEFQNGALYKFTLPIGRVADWAALAPVETIDFEADADKGTITLRAGGSCAVFRNQLETKQDGLWEISPLYFNDGNGTRRDFQLIPPAGLENISASLKAHKAQCVVARLRGKEVNAKRDLKAAVSEHCARLATLAGGIAPATARARLIVKSLRMLRRALAAPMDVIPWLGETIEPAGEYDAGPVSHFTAEHGELIGAILAARAAYKAWNDDKRFSYRGPKSIKLREAITRAEHNLNLYICREFRAEMERNNLPPAFVYWQDGKAQISVSDSSTYSRARNSVRDWTSRKLDLAQAYMDARAARIKAEAKAAKDAAPVETTPETIQATPEAQAIEKTPAAVTLIEHEHLQDGGDYDVNGAKFNTLSAAESYAKTASSMFSGKSFEVCCGTDCLSQYTQGRKNWVRPGTDGKADPDTSVAVTVQVRPQDIDIEKAKSLPFVQVISAAIQPIASLYAELLTAVNRGDLPAAQQLAAQIAA